MANTRKATGGAPGERGELRATPEVAAASEADRAWFAAHPGAAEYLRPIWPGEFGDRPVPAGAVFVHVVELAPGLRIRHPTDLPVCRFSDGAPPVVGAGGYGSD